jgi:hypothetical protein
MNLKCTTSCKKGVVHGLFIRAKFLYRDQDFNNEIKYIIYDLMLNEYPKKIVDSVMKPSTRNRPSSGIIYQHTVIIRYVKGISEKLRRIGNRFNLSTIFKTKHILRETLMKTWPVREAQQTKECMYSIPCGCDRCYIGERSRPLEVRIEEQNYNLTG